MSSCNYYRDRDNNILVDNNKNHEETDEQYVSMENVLETLGVPGLYQSMQIVSLMMCCIPIAFSTFSVVFTGYVPSHSCHVINETQLLVQHNLVNDTSAHVIYGPCAISLIFNRTGQKDTITTGCIGGYDFDNNDNDHGSMATEWNLVCSKNALPALVQAMFMLGGAVGSIILPPFTNCFGRKRVYILTIVGGIISQIGISFARDIYQVQALNFFSGFFFYTMFSLHFVMCSEMTISRHRQALGGIINICSTVNSILMTGVAYVFRDSWRKVYLATSIAAVIPLVLSLWVVETPEWLLSKDRHEQAEKILMKACKWNGKKVSEVRDVFRRCINRKISSTSNEPLKEHSKDSFSAIIYNRQLCILYLISLYVSFATSFAYYGFYMISSTLALDRYVSFILMAITELPACSIFLVILLRYGRKTGLLMFVGLGVLCLSVSTILIVWSINDLLLAVFAILSQFACQSTSCIWNMYLTEIFPTTLRASSVGLCCFLKLMGGLSSSFLLPLFEQSAWLPYAIMLVLCASSGLVIPLLPETRNRQLPTTVEDVIRWNRNALR